MKKCLPLLVGAVSLCALAAVPRAAHAQSGPATGDPNAPQRAVVVRTTARVSVEAPSGFDRTVYGATPSPGSDNLSFDPTAEVVNAVAVQALVSRPASGVETQAGRYLVTMTFEKRGAVASGAAFAFNGYVLGDVSDVDLDTGSSSVSAFASVAGSAPTYLGNGNYAKGYLGSDRKTLSADGITSYTLQGQLVAQASAEAYPAPPPGTLAGP